MRSFAVIGLGKFGFNVARVLYELGQEVTAIDEEKEIVQKIQEFSTQAVVTDATVAENLLALGVNSVDVAVVSMGEKMDASILIALHLKEMGVPEIWVKAINEDHGKILKRLGVTEVIHVEKEMAERIAQSLSRPNVIDYLPVSEGYSIQEFAVPTAFTGKSLADLDLRRKYGVFVIAVKELIPERVVLNPEADFVFKDSDIMVILGSDVDLDKLKAVK
jgi:trk system potassium uptake protein TrkA